MKYLPTAWRQSAVRRTVLATGWILSTILLASACQAAEPPREFDLQGFINQELRTGKRRVVVPPGRYRVVPRNQQHLLLEKLDGIEIVADGVEMICTETTRAVTIRHCRNTTLRGLVIDYDPLPFTQGRIVRLSADRSVHEIELFEGYPPAPSARAQKYEIFRPDTRTLRCEDRDPRKVEAIDARHLRITTPGGGRNPEQVGDLIVIAAEHAPHGSAAHAVECSHNVNVRLEGIELYASNCFGFLEYECDGSTYYRCKIDRRPAGDDGIRRGEPRLRSLNADAYHSKHALRGPAYIECEARFMGDDCINICGDYHMVTGSQGNELRVLAKHGMNIVAGDSVELVQYDGRRLPDAKVLAIRPAGAIREDERAFLAKQRMDEGLRTARGGMLSQAFAITLDREVEIPRGGVICSANRIGNGFSVQGCTFGYNRSRGILIKASRGEVRDNRMEGCWMSAILVAPEYWWLEAGSSSDLTITGNTISACRGTAISVEAMAGNGRIAPAGAHRNITIAKNIVTDSPLPAIRVTSTVGLRLDQNVLPQANDTSPVVQVQCQP